MKKYYCNIENIFQKTVEAFTDAKQLLAVPIFNAAHLICNTLNNQKKIWICATGRSVVLSRHFAEDLMEELKKIGLSSFQIVLLTDEALISTKNFAKKINLAGKKGDILLCIDERIKCVNIYNAMEVARQKKMECIVITGRGGSKIEKLAQISLSIPSLNERPIQQLHIHILHTLCELIKNDFDRKPPEILRIEKDFMQRITL